MIGIVVVMHGGLAREFRATALHVLGEQPGIAAVQIGTDDDRGEKQAEICAAADEVDTGDGVVVVTDLYGGSPSNLSMNACAGEQRRMLFGANVPALLELVHNRHRPVDEALHRAVEKGRLYLGSRIIRPV